MQLDSSDLGALRPEPADQMFRDAVAADVKGQASPEISTILRQPAYLDAWRDVLLDMIRLTETELGTRRDAVRATRSTSEYRGAMAEHARWSSRAKHFLACCNSRLAEVKRLRHERAQERDRWAWDDLVSRIDLLERQVTRLHSQRHAVREVAK